MLTSPDLIRGSCELLNCPSESSFITAHTELIIDDSLNITGIAFCVCVGVIVDLHFKNVVNEIVIFAHFSKKKTVEK